MILLAGKICKFLCIINIVCIISVIFYLKSAGKQRFQLCKLLSRHTLEGQRLPALPLISIQRLHDFPQIAGTCRESKHFLLQTFHHKKIPHHRISCGILPRPQIQISKCGLRTAGGKAVQVRQKQRPILYLYLFPFQFHTIPAFKISERPVPACGGLTLIFYFLPINNFMPSFQQTHFR